MTHIYTHTIRLTQTYTHTRTPQILIFAYTNTPNGTYTKIYKHVGNYMPAAHTHGDKGIHNTCGGEQTLEKNRVEGSTGRWRIEWEGVLEVS